MANQEILPAPIINLPTPTDSKLERERQAFIRLLPELLQSHAGEYVAVHDGKVIDSDHDEVQLALRVYKQVGYVPIYIDLVTDKPVAPVRIPSPRFPVQEKR